MSVLLERIPLVPTEAGDIFLEGSRIPLETPVDAFNAGHTPEDFVADHPHLELAKGIYSELTPHLAHSLELYSNQ